MAPEWTTLTIWGYIGTTSATYAHDEQVEMLAITEMGEPTGKRSTLPIEPAGLRVWTFGSTIVIGGVVADACRMILPAVRCALDTPHSTPY